MHFFAPPMITFCPFLGYIYVERKKIVLFGIIKSSADMPCFRRAFVVPSFKVRFRRWRQGGSKTEWKSPHHHLSISRVPSFVYEGVGHGGKKMISFWWRIRNNCVYLQFEPFDCFLSYYGDLYTFACPLALLDARRNVEDTRFD